MRSPHSGSGELVEGGARVLGRLCRCWGHYTGPCRQADVRPGLRGPQERTLWFGMATGRFVTSLKSSCGLLRCRTAACRSLGHGPSTCACPFVGPAASLWAAAHARAHGTPSLGRGADWSQLLGWTWQLRAHSVVCFLLSPLSLSSAGRGLAGRWRLRAGLRVSEGVLGCLSGDLRARLSG